MDYTPKQLRAFAFIAERRRAAELRERLHVARLAASGNDKAINAQLKEWDDPR